jgi:hypothetical protein
MHYVDQGFIAQPDKFWTSGPAPTSVAPWTFHDVLTIAGYNEYATATSERQPGYAMYFGSKLGMPAVLGAIPRAEDCWVDVSQDARITKTNNNYFWYNQNSWVADDDIGDFPGWRIGTPPTSPFAGRPTPGTSYSRIP